MDCARTERNDLCVNTRTGRPNPRLYNLWRERSSRTSIGWFCCVGGIWIDHRECWLANHDLWLTLKGCDLKGWKDIKRSPDTKQVFTLSTCSVKCCKMLHFWIDFACWCFIIMIYMWDRLLSVSSSELITSIVLFRQLNSTQGEIRVGPSHQVKWLQRHSVQCIKSVLLIFDN